MICLSAAKPITQHIPRAGRRRLQNSPSTSVLALWVAGVLLQLLRTARDLSATRGLLQGKPLSSPSIEALLARVVERLQIRRRFQVLVSAQSGPFVFGLWKPTLVLPAALIAGLTPDQLEAVLLHELSHLRRYDDFVNLAQLLVEAILFFSPGPRWISGALRSERESSCDALAVAGLASPWPLAEALALAAEGCTTTNPVLTPALGLANDREPGLVLDRVQRILHPNRRPQLRLSWRALAVTVVLAGCLLAVLGEATVWSFNRRSQGRPSGGSLAKLDAAAIRVLDDRANSPMKLMRCKDDLCTELCQRTNGFADGNHFEAKSHVISRSGIGGWVDF